VNDMDIGEVARRSGVPVSTLLFYTARAGPTESAHALTGRTLARLVGSRMTWGGSSHRLNEIVLDKHGVSADTWAVP
jgi:hypothetical protein